MRKIHTVTAIKIGLFCWTATVFSLSHGATQQVTVVNKTNHPLTIYAAIPYSIPGCAAPKCTFALAKDGEKLLTFAKAAFGVRISAGADSGCAVTQAEFTLNAFKGINFTDISLVNGQNYFMSITSDNPSYKPIDLNTADLNKILNIQGVYPPGCAGCNTSVGTPCKGIVKQCMASKDKCQSNTPAKSEPSDKFTVTIKDPS